MLLVEIILISPDPRKVILFIDYRINYKIIDQDAEIL